MEIEALIKITDLRAIDLNKLEKDLTDYLAEKFPSCEIKVNLD